MSTLQKSATGSRAGTRRTAAKVPPSRSAVFASSALWWAASVILFAGIWEFFWYMTWANPMLLPPPHIFLQNILEVGRLFDKSTRLGDPSAGLIAFTIAKTIGASTLRVIIGLGVALVGSLTVGMTIRYSPLFGRLILPVINLLAPVSPIAWLPIAMLIFGLGNAPAIFLVYIALFFIMTLATLNLIDTLPPSYIQVARIMGATRRQIFMQVIVPAILPGLFVVLRLNLFAAWMIVLIAESVGVGGGLGLVVIISRNTFDAQLAFFTMFVIGVVGFALDVSLRKIQRRVLYWTP
ncbi:MAG: ABC transporter permease subunit [Phycisphaerales bacterium]